MYGYESISCRRYEVRYMDPEYNGMKLNKVQVVINPSFSRHKPRGAGRRCGCAVCGAHPFLAATPDDAPRPAEESSKILCKVRREHKEPERLACIIRGTTSPALTLQLFLGW